MNKMTQINHFAWFINVYNMISLYLDIYRNLDTNRVTLVTFDTILWWKIALQGNILFLFACGTNYCFYSLFVCLFISRKFRCTLSEKVKTKPFGNLPHPTEIYIKW